MVIKADTVFVKVTMANNVFSIITDMSCNMKHRTLKQGTMIKWGQSQDQKGKPKHSSSMFVVMGTTS